MRFGECYRILESGGLVTRKSWDGVFVWLKPSAKVKSEWCKDSILKMLADANGGEVDAEQVLCKYSLKERKVMTGWCPQQDDLAADDWDNCYARISNGNLELKVYGVAKKENEFVGDLFEGADVIRKP